MKILTICSAGTVRSVAMAHCLKHNFDQDALPAGRDANSQQTLDMLSDWADVIILMQPKYGEGILKRHVHKVVPPALTDVGMDRWGNALDPELQSIVGEIAKDLVERKLIRLG